MVRGLLIRRLSKFARRHVWNGAALGLFAAALITGWGQVAAGAGEFADALVPVTAEASDEPARAGDGTARLPMFGFGVSHYSPQVLFPVRQHLLPLWLQLKGEFDLAPLKAGKPGAGLALRALRPAIAICIDDLGEDLAGTDRAMALPKAVALSFLPYAEATPFLAQEAESRGHDVLAHVPMEALSGTDPGAMALKTGAPDIARLIAWNIARVPGLKGINNHEGSRFTEDTASLTPVAQVLAAKHLFFFDSRTVADSKVVEVAARFGVMSAGRDVFLDDVLTEDAVRQQLDALAVAAKQGGVAIAIGHPHDVTLKVLTAWLAENHGVELISLPEAMRRKNLNLALALR